MSRWAALSVLLAVSGCTSEALTLVVDVRTDLVAGIDFTAVEVTHDGPGARFTPTNVAVFRSDDYVAGVRAAEVSGLEGGSHTVTVRLRGSDGSERLSRRTIVEMNGTQGVTVVLTRDCRGVTCPGPSDGTGATACRNGLCVEETCTPESPESCGGGCSGDADCPGGSDCARGVCLDGACLLDTDDAMCGADEYCDPTAGCTPDPTTAMDAGPPMLDAGLPDAGPMMDAGEPDLADDFDDGTIGTEWSMFLGGGGTFEEMGGALRIVPEDNSYWFDRNTGPLLHQPRTDDFVAQVSVEARDAAGTSMIGTGLCLAGLLARDPTGKDENYVWVGIGYDSGSRITEVKSTVDGVTTFVTMPFPDFDGDVRLCRVGATYYGYWRPDPMSPWMLGETYDRADMDTTVQLGIWAGCNSAPADMAADLDDFSVRPVSSVADCTR